MKGQQKQSIIAKKPYQVQSVFLITVFLRTDADIFLWDNLILYLMNQHPCKEKTQILQKVRKCDKDCQSSLGLYCN